MSESIIHPPYDWHFVPRFGMFAGPNYAGGQVLSEGFPPNQVWAVDPVNFLDAVTRNHDINYTYIQARFVGDDQATVELRNAAYWQADREMLINTLSYRPAPGDWLTRAKGVRDI